MSRSSRLDGCTASCTLATLPIARLIAPRSFAATYGAIPALIGLPACGPYSARQANERGDKKDADNSGFCCTSHDCRKSCTASSSFPSAFAGIGGTSPGSRSEFGSSTTPGSPKRLCHQSVKPCQRCRCTCVLFPARTSEFAAVKWPLNRPCGNPDE